MALMRLTASNPADPVAVVYKHDYSEISVYGHAVALLKEHGGKGGVHVDVGCGYGAIAEPIRDELGLTYVGFDLAEDGLLSLQERGFAGHQIDLSRPDLAEVIIREAIGDRPVRSLSILDTLEHLTNGPDVLAMLRRLAGESDAVLVVSVPNVTHKDIALKALIGRWDVTEAGLLDHTHVDFYNLRRLRLRANSAGWREVGLKDWLLETSDQNFPAELALFDVSSPIGGYLRGFVGGANPDALVNQFVRAFRPMEPVQADGFADRDEHLDDGLSVVTVLRAHSPAKSIDALKGLARQRERALEVILIDARGEGAIDKNEVDLVLAKLADMKVRVVKADLADDGAAFRLGLDWATRRNAAFLPQHEKPTTRWATELIAGFEAHPGRVVWASPGADAGRRLSPFLEPGQPLGAFVVPVMTARLLGSSIDGCKPEATAQVLITLAAHLCGIAHAPVSTPLIGKRTQTGARDPVPDAVLSFLAGRPILTPASEVVAIERSYQEARAASETVSSLPEADGSLWNLRVLAASARDYHAALVNLRLQEQDWHAREADWQAQKVDWHAREADWGAREADWLAQQADWRAREADLLTERRLLEICPQLNEFVGPQLQRLRQAPRSASEEEPRPFLSIITRTQGQRLSTLTETLLTLGGQSCDDFELVLVVHSRDEAVLEQVRAVVDEFPKRLTSRISVIQCVRHGRSAPINDALNVANGEYIAVLDDDDFVFANYVEHFKEMAREAPGRLVRAVCVRQDFAYEADGQWPRSRAQSWFQPIWAANYDAVEHLYTNNTPFMTIAFPGALFRQLGLRFDETLTTLEDWHLTTNAASLCGVHSVPEITSIYRWWTNAGSSLFEHATSEWVDNRARVIDEGSMRPILLPRGSRASIVATTDRMHALEREVIALYREREALQQLWSSRSWHLAKPLRWLLKEDLSPMPGGADGPDDEAVMALARQYLASRSWRISRPMRTLTARLRGHADDSYRPDHPIPSGEEARRILKAVRFSSSWRLTMPLRMVARLLRRARK